MLESCSFWTIPTVFACAQITVLLHASVGDIKLVTCDCDGVTDSFDGVIFPVKFFDNEVSVVVEAGGVFLPLRLGLLDDFDVNVGKVFIELFMWDMSDWPTEGAQNRD